MTNADRSFGLIIPISSAMALAVIKLSPVTILTVIPAILHLRIAYGTSGRAISFTPIMHSKTYPDFYTSNTPLLSDVIVSSYFDIGLYAKHRVLSDLFAMLTIELYICFKVFSSMLTIYPVEAFIHLSHDCKTISEAPFNKIICSPLSYKMVLILFRSELKGNFFIIGFFYLSSR